MELATHTEDLLGTLGSEEKQEKRKIQVDPDDVLDAIVQGFDRALEHRTSELGSFCNPHLYLQHCFPIVKELPTISAADVYKFCVILEGLSDDKQLNGRVIENGRDIAEQNRGIAGVYISVLTYKCSDSKESVVIPGNICLEFPYIGCWNPGRHIIIDGDVGINAGYFMKKGVLEIRGDCDGWLGYAMTGGGISVQGNADHLAMEMKGGVILVHGNADTISRMSGGKVIIDGDVGSFVENVGGNSIIHIRGDLGEMGKDFQGAELRVDGEFPKWQRTYGAKVYHKDVLIAENGKKVKRIKKK